MANPAVTIDFQVDSGPAIAELNKISAALGGIGKGGHTAADGLGGAGKGIKDLGDHGKKTDEHMGLLEGTLHRMTANLRGPIGGAIKELVDHFGVLAIETLGVIELLRGLSEAFHLGHELEDLSARTGIAVDDLAVMSQGFKFAGLSMEEGSLLINKMQKALGGMSETGEATSHMFKKLGLNMEELSKKGGKEQIEEIGAAINGLGNQADKVQAAMLIFGRGGGKMLALFAHPEGMKLAEQMVGSQAQLLEEHAGEFAMVDMLLSGAFSQKLSGFFVGMGSELANPLIDALKAFNEIDFAGAGKLLGSVLVPFVEYFGGLMKGARDLAEIGNILFGGGDEAEQREDDERKASKILKGELSPAQAGITDEQFEGINILARKRQKFLGQSDYEREEDEKRDLANAMEDARKMGKHGKGGESGNDPHTKEHKIGIISDSLTSVGGGGGVFESTNIAESQLKETEKQTGLLEKISEQSKPGSIEGDTFSDSVGGDFGDTNSIANLPNVDFGGGINTEDLGQSIAEGCGGNVPGLRNDEDGLSYGSNDTTTVMTAVLAVLETIAGNTADNITTIHATGGVSVTEV